MHDNGMSVFDIIRKRENLTEYDDLKRVSSTYYYIINNKSWKNIQFICQSITKTTNFQFSSGKV